MYLPITQASSKGIQELETRAGNVATAANLCSSTVWCAAQSKNPRSFFVRCQLHHRMDQMDYVNNGRCQGKLLQLLVLAMLFCSELTTNWCLLNNDAFTACCVAALRHAWHQDAAAGYFIT